MCRGSKIKEKVRKLKILHENSTPLEVIHYRNIVVCYLGEICVSKGAYEKFEGIQYIYINTKLCDFQKRMTLAHELGHAILHPDVDTFELKKIAPHSLTKYEYEAQVFAAEFLLGDDILEKHPYDSIYDIARKECVSVELVKLKLNNLDRSKLENYFAI